MWFILEEIVFQYLSVQVCVTVIFVITMRTRTIEETSYILSSAEWFMLTAFYNAENFIVYYKFPQLQGSQAKQHQCLNGLLHSFPLSPM